ncbi:DNA polymerase III subunit delta [Catenovulum sp. 2E275]|uniref:DNA polymerase III subunit delta n=1 Tax=Catenovulum sp. 2E275 TaxID=2980497 RepID=UPI0021CFE9D7|nr:DNA polymerase III subunit delta [Catenovulum sp. 2E275]MCU4675435.1 DNA polymerase III subunit delta [Catenovulum sp. 2E275]
MRVYFNQLSQQLTKPLPNLILLFGDEPYQQQAALDQIRACCTAQQIEERIVFQADDKFNWQQIMDEAQSLSLFASRKLIEVELPSAKPGRNGSTFLQEWMQLNDNEHTLLLWGGKLGADQTKSKWFKSIEPASWFIPVYDIDRQNLPGWFNQQCQQHQVQLTPDALHLVCDLFEGNLLSGAQEISRLALIYPNQQIDAEQIKAVASDQSRFTVFQLADDLLNNHREKVVQILTRLQGEDLEPVIVTWLLQREAETLAQLTIANNQQAFDAECKKLRVWDNRKGLYRQALNRLNLSMIEQILKAIGQFEVEYKSHGLLNPYIQLAHICALFSGEPKLFNFNQIMLAHEPD